MKKSLVVLASMAAIGAASAQSSVTLYGIADVVVHKDKGVGAQMTSGGLSTSRWGVKGTEDLGGGLAANFLFEQAVDVTTGGANGFNRQAYLGLSGGFGEFKFGNVYTAFDDISAVADPTFDSNVFDPTAVWQSGGYNANPFSNIYYATPSFGGFSGAASYSLDGSKNDVTAFHVKFQEGPLFVGMAYQDESDVGGDKYTRLNATYDFGMFTLLAGYGDSKNADVTDYSIGANVPLASNITLSVGYAAANPSVGDTRSSYGLAVAYDLSKRTTLYAGLRNDNAAAVAAGGVDTRFGVGVRHSF